MDRIQIIQEIFSKTEFKNYLEIGCRKGKSFLPIKASNKIAVDPEFKIPITRKLKWLAKWPSNRNNQYFEEESDVFFTKRKKSLKQLGHLDIVLVDGLHTFRTSLRDVLHSLEYLNPKGLILLHDCYPPNAASAFVSGFFPSEEEQKNIEGWTGEWCGDVWKSIVYLIKKFPDQLEVGVIDTDYGLGFVLPKHGFKNGEFKIDEELFGEINKLTYEEMMKNPSEIIQLKPAGHAEKIISQVITKA